MPGGGVALLRASDAVKVDALEGDEQTGARIILRALEEPVRQLAQNAGLEGSVVVNEVRKAKKGHGLNADTGEIVDLVAAGVIDPAMVTRSALQNAASIAKNILTTEAIVAEMPGEGRRRRDARRDARRHGRNDVGSQSASAVRREGPASAGPSSRLSTEVCPSEFRHCRHVSSTLRLAFLQRGIEGLNDRPPRPRAVRPRVQRACGRNVSRRQPRAARPRGGRGRGAGCVHAPVAQARRLRPGSWLARELPHDDGPQPGTRSLAHAQRARGRRRAVQGRARARTPLSPRTPPTRSSAATPASGCCARSTPCRASSARPCCWPSARGSPRARSRRGRRAPGHRQEPGAAGAAEGPSGAGGRRVTRRRADDPRGRSAHGRRGAHPADVGAATRVPRAHSGCRAATAATRRATWSSSSA